MKRCLVSSKGGSDDEVRVHQCTRKKAAHLFRAAGGIALFTKARKHSRVASRLQKLACD
jgi:hypothetical protein